MNLEEGLPTEVEDAYPTAFGNREIQGQLRYERKNGENVFGIQPQLECGFARNWQGKISLPFIAGGGDKTGSGDIGLEAFYNFNTESLKTPAIALSGRVDFPTGSNSSGVDTQLKFIATKTLGAGELLQRLHLNLIYRNNAKAEVNERSNRYSGILGYSQRLGPDMLLVTDYVYEQDRERGKNSQILEVGVRRSITPLLVGSVGFGVGLNQDSPDFRLTGAFQKSF